METRGHLGSISSLKSTMVLQKNFARDSPLSVVPDTKDAAFKRLCRPFLDQPTNNRWKQGPPTWVWTWNQASKFKNVNREEDQWQ